jgi:aspartate kinase
MKVFKFGGASVKDSAAVRNVMSILHRSKKQKLVVVISAMGKTTNLLEELVSAIFERNRGNFKDHLKKFNEFHLALIKELFPEKTHKVYRELEDIINEINENYDQQTPENQAFEYDQIVSLGEVISTKIVSAYLRDQGLNVRWADARKIIRTNNNYREAEVDWKRTQELIATQLSPYFEDVNIQVTQGFIGHTAEGMTTTLGREGSDFTAGIIAHCINAESVTIWKDVPGMLNADPKYFENTVKLKQISFYEAMELSYYGASVIHPKTIKPLENKNIPLYVRSFIEPDKEGTIIQKSTDKDHLIPSFIFKFDQLLLSFKTRDFSFIMENHLSDIFGKLSALGATINVMQNSALSFSVLVDQAKVDVTKLLASFQDDYEVRFNEHLELVTIRHYDQATINLVSKDKVLILEQKTRETVRIVQAGKS